MKPFVEFSKKVVKLSVVVWVCGAIYGAVFNGLQALFISSHGPTICGINIDLTGLLIFSYSAYRWDTRLHGKSGIRES